MKLEFLKNKKIKIKNQGDSKNSQTLEKEEKLLALFIRVRKAKLTPNSRG